MRISISTTYSTDSLQAALQAWRRKQSIPQPLEKILSEIVAGHAHDKNNRQIADTLCRLGYSVSNDQIEEVLDMNAQLDSAIASEATSTESTGDIVVNARYLAVAALWVSTDPTKAVLNAVQVARHKRQGILLGATNGHVAILIHDPNGVLNLDRDVNLFIPKEFASIAKKATSPATVALSDSDQLITSTFTVESKKGVLSTAGTTPRSTAYDQYPRLEQLYPQRQGNDDFNGPVFFNPEYLRLLADSNKILNTSPEENDHFSAVGIHPGKYCQPVLCQIRENITALIMPIQRRDEYHKSLSTTWR